jgi:C4-type Zn-finger protein
MPDKFQCPFCGNDKFYLTPLTIIEINKNPYEEKIIGVLPKKYQCEKCSTHLTDMIEKFRPEGVR